jgi:hypothetical protein
MSFLNLWKNVSVLVGDHLSTGKECILMEPAQEKYLLYVLADSKDMLML